MPQSTRKNRNDANPPTTMPPLDFAAAAQVSGFATDLPNNSYTAGFGNAFTNPFHASRTNTSHHQSGTFNQNPFGMSGFAMTGPYTNAYPSYGMTMGQSMKHQHTDNSTTHHSQRQHHGHNHDASFGQVTAFSNDPSISFISQAATNTNPYTQNTTASNAQSHHTFDTLTSTASRHKNTNASTTYDPYSNPSHSASDLFATSHRRHHASSSNATDLSVLSYGTQSAQNNNNQNNGNSNNNNASSTSNHNTRNSLRSSHYNSSSSSAKHNEYVKHAFASPNLLSANTSNLRSNPHTSSSSHHRPINNQTNNQHIFGRYYNTSSNTANNPSSNKTANNYLGAFADPTQQHLYSTTSANGPFGNLLPPTSQATHLAHSHSSHSKKGTHSKTSRTHSTGSPRKINRSKSYSSPKKPHFKSSSRSKNKFLPLQSSNLRKSSKLSEVTGVERLSLHHNPPVNGCNIEPFVILSCENGGFIQSDDKDCRFTWYRSKKRICFARDCNKPAFLQCLSCSKLQIEHESSYYCSTQCMQDAWSQHKDVHKFKEFDYDLSKWNSNDIDTLTNDWKVKNAKECDKFVENPDTLYCKFPPPIVNKWEKIHNNTTKRYKPRSDDIGRQLLLECAPTIKLGTQILKHKLKTASKNDKKEKGKKDKKDEEIKKEHKLDKKKKVHNKMKKTSIINECQDTSPCLPRPQLSSNRMMHYYHPQNRPSDQDKISADDFTFRVLSYNCLAPIYCTQAMYDYVEPYKLEWDYRKYNIKREILRYNPDVICLQEVQHNHFDEYFTKELSKEGYEGMYRPKSRGTRDPKSVDGCAIFFKSNRFKVSSRYHIDFNDTSNLYLNMLQNGSEGKQMTEEQVKFMAKRLMKGNIAMIVVLEEKERKSSKNTDKNKDEKEKKEMDKDDHKTNNDKGSSSNNGNKKKDSKTSINISDHNMTHSSSTSMNNNVKKQICIANTHVYWDPSYTDVKLWQAWILCEEIWRALGRELPLILCGDFNSEPKSAVYEYLTKGRVDLAVYDELLKEYEVKKNCILPPRDHLRHTLGLKSHYNRNGEEPNYTNYTRLYKGTLDYVLYSSKSIESIGYLQELPESELSKEEAFPNSVNSSDHIPLMGTFAFASDYQNWKRERRQSQNQSQHISSKSSKYHHHHHHHTGHHGHNSSSASSNIHAQQAHSRGSSSRFASSTSSNSNSSSIRPSAPPRHRQHSHNVNQSPQRSRILPQASNITNSQSSTHTNSKSQASFSSTHRRHHSLEILQNTNSNSSTNNNNNNNNSTSNKSSADKHNEKKIENMANIVIPQHINDDGKRMKIEKLASQIQSKQRSLDSDSKILLQQLQQRKAQKHYYSGHSYSRVPLNQLQTVIEHQKMSANKNVKPAHYDDDDFKATPK